MGRVTKKKQYATIQKTIRGKNVYHMPLETRYHEDFDMEDQISNYNNGAIQGDAQKKEMRMIIG